MRKSQVVAKAPAPTKASKQPLTASESADVFGPFPLIAGEAGASYEVLYKRISEGVEPTDFVEEIFVREFVDLNWEVFRLRRLKANFLTQRAQTELRNLIARYSDGRAADALMERFRSGDEQAMKEVEALLAKQGLSMESLTARALTGNLDAVERVDYLLGNAESRRNHALHEIQRHRLLLAERLRQVVQEIDVQPIRSPADESPAAE